MYKALGGYNLYNYIIIRGDIKKLIDYSAFLSKSPTDSQHYLQSYTSVSNQFFYKILMYLVSEVLHLVVLKVLDQL